LRLVDIVLSYYEIIRSKNRNIYCIRKPHFLLLTLSRTFYRLKAIPSGHSIFQAKGASTRCNFHAILVACNSRKLHGASTRCNSSQHSCIQLSFKIYFYAYGTFLFIVIKLFIKIYNFLLYYNTVLYVSFVQLSDWSRIACTYRKVARKLHESFIALTHPKITDSSKKIVSFTS